MTSAMRELRTNTADRARWSVHTVARGLGHPLENLVFDGRGGLLVSKTLFSGFGSIERITPDGKVSTYIPDIEGPGAIAVRGNTVYFNTGHTGDSGVLGSTDGTIDTFDMDTQRRGSWATGLTMPTGMALLPNGDAVTSTLIGPKMGLTLARKDSPSTPVRYAKDSGGNSGLAVSNDGRILYAVRTLSTGDQIARIDIAEPENRLGGLRVDAPWPLDALDDLTVGPDGMIYTVGEHGFAYRVDPATGATCQIALGVTLGSSLRFGSGSGWDPNSLYSTGFDGTVRRLIPPEGKDS